jgi:hypothetical protein
MYAAATAVLKAPDSTLLDKINGDKKRGYIWGRTKYL